MTFEDYQDAVKKAAKDYQQWRVGQAAFNVLCGVRPDLSEQVRATLLDPFHDSNILVEFYAWVKENW